MLLRVLSKTNYLFLPRIILIENLDLLEELVTTAYFTEDSILREQDIIQQERDVSR